MPLSHVRNCTLIGGGVGVTVAVAVTDLVNVDVDGGAACCDAEQPTAARPIAAAAIICLVNIGVIPRCELTLIKGHSSPFGTTHGRAFSPRSAARLTEPLSNHAAAASMVSNANCQSDGFHSRACGIDLQADVIQLEVYRDL